MIKNIQQTSNRRKILQNNKECLQINFKKDWEQRKDCPLLAFLFNIVLEALAVAIGKK